MIIRVNISIDDAIVAFRTLTRFSLAFISLYSFNYISTGFI